MEYFLGSLTAIMTMVIINLFNNKSKKADSIKLKISQSRSIELVRPTSSFDYSDRDSRISRSQSFKHQASKEIMVIFMDNQAYWIKDNAFYVADLIDKNIINKDSAKVVDIMGMDNVQLDKMIFIVDKLSKGNRDDSGNSGDQSL